MKYLRFRRLKQYRLPLPLACLAISLIMTDRLPAEAEFHGKRLDELANQGLSRDRYDPLSASGLLVPSFQLGYGLDYDYESFDEIRIEYYPKRHNKYYLLIPDLESRQLSVGGEIYLGLGGPRDRLWIGGQLTPEGLRTAPYLRGVRYQSRLAKFHYLAKLHMASDEVQAITEFGLQTYPFRKSRHSYIDTKTRLINHQTHVGHDRLSRRIQATSFSIDLGHGWARFGGVNGLEIFGSVGIGHSRLRHSTANCVGRNCELQAEDTDLRMLIGALFQSRIH